MLCMTVMRKVCTNAYNRYKCKCALRAYEFTLKLERQWWAGAVFLIYVSQLVWSTFEARLRASYLKDSDRSKDKKFRPHFILLEARKNLILRSNKSYLCQLLFQFFASNSLKFHRNRRWLPATTSGWRTFICAPHVRIHSHPYRTNNMQRIILQRIGSRLFSWPRKYTN